MKILTAPEWQNMPSAFIALWTDAMHAYALYQPAELVALPLEGSKYPALSPCHPGAAWFERLDHDLNGRIAADAVDTSPAIEQFRGADGKGDWPEFLAPDGAGVHQIAMGPVYGLITEPAHFRFSVIGERLLKLETRLGYAHKAVLGLIRGKSPRLAARFAARICGDATVAHSLAFAQAAEAALEITAPPRAQALRAVMAEAERVANHCGDLGGIAGAAGAALLETRFGWHREAVCQAAHAAFGHRLMMDVVIPGGIAGDINTGGAAAVLAALEALQEELPGLETLYGTAGLRDRLAGTGVILPPLAAAYAAGGVTGRAAGQVLDARVSPGYAPYHQLAVNVANAADGDVAARVKIRLAELKESARLIRALLNDLPEGQIAVAPPSGSGVGLGVAESCRGPVWHWLSLNAGVIADAFIADASTLHWPLLARAATAGSVADFPLIHRSINPSCSGVDL